MEAQRSQTELNNMIHTNQRHGELTTRIANIEQNIELIKAMLQEIMPKATPKAKTKD